MLNKLKIAILFGLILFPIVLVSQTELKQIGTLKFNLLHDFKDADMVTYSGEKSLFYFIKKGKLFAFNGENEILVSHSKFTDLTGYVEIKDTLILWSKNKIYLQSQNRDTLIYETKTKTIVFVNNYQNDLIIEISSNSGYDTDLFQLKKIYWDPSIAEYRKYYKPKLLCNYRNNLDIVPNDPIAFYNDHRYFIKYILFNNRFISVIHYSLIENGKETIKTYLFNSKIDKFSLLETQDFAPGIPEYLNEKIKTNEFDFVDIIATKYLLINQINGYLKIFCGNSQFVDSLYIKVDDYEQETVDISDKKNIRSSKYSYKYPVIFNDDFVLSTVFKNSNATILSHYDLKSKMKNIFNINSRFDNSYCNFIGNTGKTYFLKEYSKNINETSGIYKVTDYGYYWGQFLGSKLLEIYADKLLWDSENKLLYKIVEAKNIESRNLIVLNGRSINDFKYINPGWLSYRNVYWGLQLEYNGTEEVGFTSIGEKESWKVNKNNGLFSNYVENIIPYNNNSYWVLTDYGAQLYDLNSKKFTRNYKYNKNTWWTNKYDHNSNSNGLVPNQFVLINNKIAVFSNNENRDSLRSGVYLSKKLVNDLYISENETFKQYPLNSPLKIFNLGKYIGLLYEINSKEIKFSSFNPESDSVPKQIKMFNGHYLASNDSVLFYNSMNQIFKYSFLDNKLDSSFYSKDNSKFIFPKWSNYLHRGIIENDFILIENVSTRELSDGDWLEKYLVQFIPNKNVNIINLKQTAKIIWNANLSNGLFQLSDEGIFKMDLSTLKMKQYFLKTPLKKIDYDLSDIELINDRFYLTTLQNNKILTRFELVNDIQPKPKIDIVNLLNTSQNIGTNKYDYGDIIRINWSGELVCNTSVQEYEIKIPQLDTNWISTTSSFQDYYNLDDGEYEILCRYKNDMGESSEITELHFTILPPWYQTWWAYSGYGLLVFGLIYGIGKIQVQQSKKKEHIKSEREFEQRENVRKSEELEKARKMQLSMLPQNNIDNSEISVYGKMRTASEVGGDYYDFIRIDDNRYCIAAGDATGHGNAAGLIVGMVKIALISSVGKQHQGFSLSELMQTINLSLKQSMNYRGMGMCLTVLIIDLKSGEFEISSSGFPYPYFYSQSNNQLTPLVFQGPPLGFMENVKFPTQHFTMQPGDSLYLMSDGFAERMNETDKMYGYEKIEVDIKSIISDGVEYGVDRLFALNDEFANGRLNDDDMTVVVVRKK